MSIDGGAAMSLDAATLSYTATGFAGGQSVSFTLVALAGGSCPNSEPATTECVTLSAFVCDEALISSSIGANKPNPVMQGQNVHLLATSTGLSEPITYVWSPDNGTPVDCIDTNCPHLIVTPLENTTYSVTITDANGCSSTATYSIEIREPNGFLVPTAFTPNGDGMNDKFRVHGYNVEEYRLQVYNRWGAKVYDSDFISDMEEGWTGRYNGHICELGVYVFTVDVRYTDGTTAFIKDNVTLIH